MAVCAQQTLIVVVWRIVCMAVLAYIITGMIKRVICPIRLIMAVRAQPHVVVSRRITGMAFKAVIGASMVKRNVAPVPSGMATAAVVAVVVFRSILQMARDALCGGQVSMGKAGIAPVIEIVAGRAGARIVILGSLTPVAVLTHCCIKMRHISPIPRPSSMAA